MLISVIITTHNRAGLLREAIESVLNQELCGAEIELIVVDDASTDDTPAVVASYPTAKYVRTQQGTCAGSRNVGISEAAGDWIAILDDDDVWLPHKLRTNVQSIQQHPKARLIFSAAQICDYQLVPGSVWAGPDLTHHINAYEAFLDDLPSPSTVLLHKDILQTVGLFDITVPRAEDRDLWFRILTTGAECAVDTEVLVLYRWRQTEDGEVIQQSYLDTMTVFHRYFASGVFMRPAWKRRQQVIWHIRGWYANLMMRAVRCAQDQNKHALAVRFRRYAFQMSPVHSVKRILSERRW